MKAVLEEYAYAVIAVLTAGLILIFLIQGIQSGGFLEVLTRRFSSMTFG